MDTKKSLTCPNCRKGKMHRILGEWICHECEYHSITLKKKSRGSFR